MNFHGAFRLSGSTLSGLLLLRLLRRFERDQEERAPCEPNTSRCGVLILLETQLSPGQGGI